MSRVPRAVVDRRRFLGLAATGALAAGLGLAKPARAARAGDPLGAAAVYFRATGHHVAPPILDWWLQHGRERVLGWPVSEPRKVGGQTLQFFERGALASRAETADPLGVVPLDLGRIWLDRQLDAGLKPEAQDSSWSYWYWRTQRGVHPEFWPKYLDDGAAFAFGYPITPGLVIDGQLNQVFERARFMLTSQGPVVDFLGVWEAWERSARAWSMRQATGSRFYRATDFTQDYGALEDRWAEVNLTDQMAIFYVGERPVYRALISSGKGDHATPVGEWHIWRRVENERMIGGEFGTPDYYDLRNVYFTQYFTRRYDGFHYAYWHDEFGTPQSRGCINMRYDDARWTWGFLDQGSRVVVRY